MTLFADFEETFDVFLPVDSVTNKTISFDDDFASQDADFTVEMNVLELGIEERVLFEQENATNKANVKSENANLLVKGAIVSSQSGGERYKITNTPKEYKLFPATYGVRLERTNK